MRGVTITLWEAHQAGTNEIGEAIMVETPVEVDNVLIAPASSEEILDAVNLYGRKAVYTLGIPKGDAHDWENRKVTFFGEDWRVFGIPLEGLEHLIPLSWNKKVMVERYE